MLLVRRTRSLAAGTILVLLPVISEATVIRVPGDVPTVQAGLNLLSDGDTVLVAVGVYAESLQAPALHFTLKGDVVPDTGEYPRPVIDPSALPGSDSLGCLNVPPGSWPVLEDLMFRNGAEMYPHWDQSVGGIYSYGQSMTLRRCILDSLYRACYHMRPTWENVVDSLLDCIFRNSQAMGYLQIDHPDIVQNCEFVSGNGGTLCYVGPGSRVTNCQFGACQGGGSLGLLGNDTEVSHCVFGPSTVTSSALVGIGAAMENAVIRENLFKDSEVTMCAAFGAAYAPGAFIIESNTFLNIVTEADTGACVLAGPYYSYYNTFGGSVRDNLFVNCFNHGGGANDGESRGVNNWIENRFVETQPDFNGRPALHFSSDSGSVVHRNLFVHTGFALESEAPALDAGWNFWGDASGPYHATQNPNGQGDTIVGNVNFIPWYTDTSFLAVPAIGKPLPKEFVFEAYPNPFNSTVRLRLIPNDIQIVKVELFDLLGRKVQEIWSGPLAYQKEISFDASVLTSGIYFARVTDVLSRKNLAMTKLVLLK